MTKASLALVAALAAIPVRGQVDKPTVQHVNSPAVSKPPGYSHAVVVTGGRTIYVSGQVPFDKDRKLIGGGDFAAQVKQVFENIRNVLAAADATLADVVKLTVFVTDASQLQKYRDVRDQYIATAAPPASTFVEVRALARPDLMVEIEAVAVTRR